MSNRRGFTLVELVVVVLILGILAAVAVPKLLKTTTRASENSLRQTLSVLRDAIERYSVANTGKLPGDLGTEADLKADLKPYLRNFPKNPIKDSAIVSVQTTGALMTGTVNGSPGWRYDNKTGQILANSNGTVIDGSLRYDEL